MFTATRIESTIKPDKFESLNNGIWYYNYDVKESIAPSMNGDEIRYNHVQVRIAGDPTYEKCQAAILKAYKDENGTTLYSLLTLDQTSNDQIEDIIYNIKVDFGQAKPLTELEIAKRDMLRKINSYDISSNVNSFYLNGLQVWLDKSTRVGLMNSLSIEKDAGKTESILWFNNISLKINIDKAIQMLSALEIYALACYNKTAEHRAAVEALNTEEDVNNYDYKDGYPEKLKLTV